MRIKFFAVPKMTLINETSLLVASVSIFDIYVVQNGTQGEHKLTTIVFVPLAKRWRLPVNSVCLTRFTGIYHVDLTIC